MPSKCAQRVRTSVPTSRHRPQASLCPPCCDFGRRQRSAAKGACQCQSRAVVCVGLTTSHEQCGFTGGDALAILLLLMPGRPPNPHQGLRRPCVTLIFLVLLVGSNMGWARPHPSSPLPLLPSLFSSSPPPGGVREDEKKREGRRGRGSSVSATELCCCRFKGMLLFVFDTACPKQKEQRWRL